MTAARSLVRLLAEEACWLPLTNAQVVGNHDWVSRVRKAYERLERYAEKLARTVLRGRDGGNAVLLPDENDISGLVQL